MSQTTAASPSSSRRPRFLKYETSDLPMSELEYDYHRYSSGNPFDGIFMKDRIYFLAIEKTHSFGVENRFALILTHDKDPKKVMYFDHERRPAGPLLKFIDLNAICTQKNMKVVGVAELSGGPSIDGYGRDRSFVFLELFVKTDDFAWKSLTFQANEEMKKIKSQGDNTRRYLWFPYVCAKYYQILHPELTSLKYGEYLKKSSYYVYCAYCALKASMRVRRPLKSNLYESHMALEEYNGLIPSVIKIMESHPGSGRSNAELVPKSTPLPKYTQEPAGEGSANKLKQAVTKVKSAIPSKPDPNSGLVDSIALSSIYMKKHTKIIQEQEQAGRSPAGTVHAVTTPASAGPVQATASSSSTSNNTGANTNNNNQNRPRRRRNVATTSVVRTNQIG